MAKPPPKAISSVRRLARSPIYSQRHHPGASSLPQCGPHAREMMRRTQSGANGGLIAPEVLKSIRRKFGVTHRMLDVLVLRPAKTGQAPLGGHYLLAHPDPVSLARHLPMKPRPRSEPLRRAF